MKWTCLYFLCIYRPLCAFPVSVGTRSQHAVGASPPPVLRATTNRDDASEEDDPLLRAFSETPFDQEEGSSNLSAIVPLSDSDFDSEAAKIIYNDESVTAANALERQKIRSQLARAIRKLEVEYEDELASCDDAVEELKDAIESVKLQKKYIRLAKLCFDKYVDTGSLETKVIAGGVNDQDPSSLEETLMDIWDSEFDESQWKEAIAKYGFDHVVFERRTRSYYHGDYTFLVELNLLPT